MLIVHDRNSSIKSIKKSWTLIRSFLSWKRAARRDQQRLQATETLRSRAARASRSSPAQHEKPTGLALPPKATKIERCDKIDDGQPTRSFTTESSGLPAHDDMGGSLSGCQRDDNEKEEKRKKQKEVDGIKDEQRHPPTIRPASGLFDHVFCGVGGIGVITCVTQGKARKGPARQAKNTNSVRDEDERKSSDG